MTEQNIKCPTCGFDMPTGNKYCSVKCLPKEDVIKLREAIKRI